MKEIPINSHNFQKVNVTTIIKGKKIYDIWRCKECGLQGKRYTLSNTIMVSNDKINCTFRKALLGKVLVYDNEQLLSSFGLISKVYDTVPCPEDQKEKYANDVWVFSESRGEPVRLLAGEYEFAR